MRSTKSILIRFALVLLASGLAASQFIHQSAAAASTNYEPVADGYVSESAPSNNYGSSQDIYLGTAPTSNGYLKFSVSGSRNIASAKLRIYSNSASTQGVTVKKVADSSWGENSLAFNNAPAMGNTIANSKVLRAKDWITVDVTSYVTGSGTYSFGITSPDSRALVLYAREAKNHQPQLVVVFDNPTPAPPTVAATKVPSSTPMPSATNIPANTPVSNSTPIATATTTSTPAATSTPANSSHVFYVATTGNDSNPGTSSQPWRTILKATNMLKAGDTAIVLAGTYDEKVGIAAFGITLQAQGKVITKGVNISGNSNTFRGFTITDATSDWGIRTTGNYNLIEGNEIYHTKQDGIWFFGSYNTFWGNYIHDILDPSISSTHVDCFQTWGSPSGPVTTHILFEKNICINNAKTPYQNQIIMAATTSTDPTIVAKIGDITFRNNILVIYNPVYSALNFWWNTGSPKLYNITVVNNTVVNMSRERRTEGATFYNIDNLIAVNNLFINFGDAHTNGINVILGSNASVHNNAFYNTDGIAPMEGSTAGDIWMQDPKIVSLTNLDFHLQSNSPLIDAGYNLQNLVTRDFDSITRPRGAGFDIGAYEFPAP